VLATIALVLLLGVKENLQIIVAGFFLGLLPMGWLMPRRKAVIGLVLCGVFFAGCYWFLFRNENRHVGIVHQFLDLEVMDPALERMDRGGRSSVSGPRGWRGPSFCDEGRILPAVDGGQGAYDWHSYRLMGFALVGTVFTTQWVLGRLPRWRWFPPGVAVALVLLLLSPPVVTGLGNLRSLTRVVVAAPGDHGRGRLSHPRGLGDPGGQAQRNERPVADGLRPPPTALARIDRFREIHPDQSP
jgi:hypothetical protein